MVNNSKVTRLNRAATASSQDIHNKASSNKLHLLILPKVLVPTASLHLTNIASQVDRLTTTSPTITVSLVHLIFFFFFLLLRILSLHNFVDNYRQEGQSGGSGYSGPESRYPGAGDSRGPGRDGFDRGGMMHRVRGGMGRGMG